MKEFHLDDPGEVKIFIEKYTTLTMIHDEFFDKKCSNCLKCCVIDKTYSNCYICTDVHYCSKQCQIEHYSLGFVLAVVVILIQHNPFHKPHALLEIPVLDLQL
jgi:hypothetical protein